MVLGPVREVVHLGVRGRRAKLGMSAASIYMAKMKASGRCWARRRHGEDDGVTFQLAALWEGTTRTKTENA